MEKATSQREAAKAVGKSMRELFKELSFPEIEKRLVAPFKGEAPGEPDELEDELMELVKLRPEWEKEIAAEAFCYSPEELLRRRLDLFKGYEETIKSFRTVREAKQWPEEIKELIEEYDDCRRQAMLRVWAATRTGKEEKLPDSLFQTICAHVEEVVGRSRQGGLENMRLSSRQKEGLARVEGWLVRHYPEGEREHVRKEQGEFIRRLLSERKAIRLLTLYLVETQEELPEQEALKETLTAYIPDTERFRDAFLNTDGKSKVQNGCLERLALAYRRAVCIASGDDIEPWFAACSGVDKGAKEGGSAAASGKKAGKKALESFDRVFRMDELTEKIFALKNKEGPEPLDSGAATRMKEQLRFRAAAAAGFSDLRTAAESCI